MQNRQKWWFWWIYQNHQFWSFLIKFDILGCQICQKWQKCVFGQKVGYTTGAKMAIFSKMAKMAILTPLVTTYLGAEAPRMAVSHINAHKWCPILQIGHQKWPFCQKRDFGVPQNHQKSSFLIKMMNHENDEIIKDEIRYHHQPFLRSSPYTYTILYTIYTIVYIVYDVMYVRGSCINDEHDEIMISWNHENDEIIKDENLMMTHESWFMIHVYAHTILYTI